MRRSSELMSTKAIAGSFAAFLLYAALSIAFFGLPHHIRTSYAGYGGDPTTFIWSLRWWPWSVMHGLNPFVSYKVWAPEGIDVTWVTSIPTLSVIGLPLTAMAGSVVTYNVLCLLAPALAAWTAYCLANYLTASRSASILAGCLFGFSPYEFGQGLGHLNLTMTCLVPVLLILVLYRIDERISRLRFVLLFSLTLLLQLGISLEVLCTACFFSGVGWLLFLPAVGVDKRQRLVIVASECILSLGVAAVLATPFLYFLFRGMAHLPAVLNDPVVASADGMGFVLPTMVNWIGAHYLGTAAYRLTAGGAEQTSYLGLPLILVLTVFFTQNFGSSRARALLAVFLTIIVCALGPRLWVGGSQTGFSMPWAFAQHVPLLRSALPVRFTLYVFLLSGLVLAYWISQAIGRARAMRWIIVAASYCVLFPDLALTRHRTPVLLPSFFDEVRSGRKLETNERVLLFPYGERGEGMIWQVQAGFRFEQLGGHTGLIPPFEGSPTLYHLMSGENPPELPPTIVDFCRKHDTHVIIAGSDTDRTTIETLRRTGWHESQEDGVTIFRDPEQGRDTTNRVH